MPEWKSFKVYSSNAQQLQRAFKIFYCSSISNSYKHKSTDRQADPTRVKFVATGRQKARRTQPALAAGNARAGDWETGRLSQSSQARWRARAGCGSSQVQRKWMDGHGRSHLLMLNKWHFISYYCWTGRDVDMSEDFYCNCGCGSHCCCC